MVRFLTTAKKRTVLPGLFTRDCEVNDLVVHSVVALKDAVAQINSQFQIRDLFNLSPKYCSIEHPATNYREDAMAPSASNSSLATHHAGRCGCAMEVRAG